MNLLELQQRANLLVEKVNNYEASLANVEWDEQDIINQHKYTDLYSLRPVLKLLFGSSISEKTNRTLNNDIALRVFASSAPMWNSSFNLLSYAKGSKKVTKYNTVGSPIIDNNNIQTRSFTQSVDYKSDQHEFMNDIHNYNQNNLITLDAKQNLLTDRNTRIKQGINYGYAANIQDALVTESQVANMFKWNTTTDETVQNNIITINRQVPGIVCYYLGNDYTGDYTATIPYNPGLSKLNQINYSTPPSYGAFYTTDQTTSQVPVWTGVLEENKGHEACRIFIPGMHYTRGKLESPQQIWQPDIKFGSTNDNLGYNWQGQALYHELVFKNRRSGAGDQNVDFIPTPATVADNDPQGLATRFALAKQKEFYKNRPWFNELDELSEMSASKLVKIIENNSYIIDEGGSFDKSKFSIDDNATVTDEGILTSTVLNYGVSAILGSKRTATTMTIISPKYTLNLEQSAQYSYDIFNILLQSSDLERSVAFKPQFRSKLNSLLVRLFIGTSVYNYDIDLYKYYSAGTVDIQFKVMFTFNESGTTTAKYYISYNDADFQLGKEYTDDSGIAGLPKLSSITATPDITQSVDLKPLKVIGDNDEILFSSTLESSRRYMTDSEFYHQFKLDYSMFAKAFTQPE